MKIQILLGMIAAGLILAGCADKTGSSTATRAATTPRGAEAGATGTGGGGGGGHFPVKTQP